MTITAKFPISTCGGKTIIPKGATGTIVALSNSKTIIATFPNLDYKVEGWYYICRFPPYVDELLCDKSLIDINA